jgi:predicted nucleotidyltransferase
MIFGLTSAQKNDLIIVFKRYLSTGSILVYGSRAKGNYSARSDIDLVIKDNDMMNHHLLEQIKEDLEDSNFPYLVDIQIYENIKNITLIEHIDRAGKILCQLK